ncbi:MAG: glycosyltransferase [Putridiphycobacter sp.]|nr:glycosyltransferase [Putridiphycobacter sp.]
MAASLIISYYQNIPNLRLILEGLNRQSNSNFEVIIAEDDANEETISFVQEMRSVYPFVIKHVFQSEDDGFRKNKMLNKAILVANHELILFIDGDCIPHKHFIKNYLKANANNAILSGRRVMLGEDISSKMRLSGTLENLNFSSLLFSNTEKIKEGIYFPWFKLSFKKRGLLGCNWGVLKSNLLMVNGFDEDYTSPGVGEDVDIEWRLKAWGLKTISMKNKAIVYHLYHKRSYTEDKVAENYAKLAQKQNADQIVCLNGLKKLIKLQ